MNCYVCSAELDGKNKTEEHIILNSCGGKLKSSSLICKTCNSLLGERYDATLASQLNFYSNMFNVRRDNGRVPNIYGIQKTSGHEFSITPGGFPSFRFPIIKDEVDIENSNIEIQVNASSMKQLKQVIAGLHRRYPQLDVNEAISSAQSKQVYLGSPVSISTSIGGDLSFRAVCKAAINFHLVSGGDKNDISHLIPYIRGGVDLRCVFNHPSKVVEATLAPNESSHIIHLEGDPHEQLLYCYIEYFNAHCYLIILNSNYTGPEISNTYCYDVVARREIKRVIPKIIKKHEITEGFGELNEHNINAIKSRCARAYEIAIRIQHDLHRADLIEKALDDILKKHPMGTLVTKAVADDMTAVIMERLTPYLLRYIQRRKM
ncbi:HNH endonuclease [Aeromonas sp. s5]|uniref:HNH endonuclease n=1 Tax=Aeromonas sp. s5 TaxID=3138487 RepID=UPI0034A1C4CD